MGLSFGGKERTGPSNQATAAGAQILGAINPALITAGGFGSEFPKYLGNLDQPIGSVLQGIPGVQTFDQFGNAQPVGSNNLPTLLPKISDIANYNTLTEKASAGTLDPTAQGLLDSFIGTATGGVDYGKLFGGLGIGGGGVGGGGGVSATPPPNIGVLTSNIIKDLPPEFQTFITNVLDSSSPERTQQVMDEFDTAISARMQQNVKMAGEDVLDVFAAEGQATSGSAKAELKSLALQAATEANAQIAAAHIQLLEQQIQAMQVGTQLTNVLTSAGAAEQGNLVALQTAELQANAAIQVAQINASADLQQSLIAATANLEAQRMGMLETGYKGLLGESAAEEVARIQGYTLPYELLMGTQKQQTATSSSPTEIGGVGGVLSGIGSIIAASDIRLKENIRPVGKTRKGHNLYIFKYKNDKDDSIGVLAQEIEQTNPNAVVEINGYKHVRVSEVF